MFKCFFVIVVLKINSDFDFSLKKHGSILTLVKDSLSEKLEGPKNQTEPKPQTSSIVISDKGTFYTKMTFYNRNRIMKRKSNCNAIECYKLNCEVKNTGNSRSIFLLVQKPVADIKY